MMRVRVQGRWRKALVQARQDHADGRVVYQVDLTLVIDGVPATTARSYLWDRRAMRPL